MEKRKCKSSWGWRAHRPPMTLLRTEGTVAYIGGSDTLPAPLSREEEQALFLNMEAQPETAGGRSSSTTCGLSSISRGNSKTPAWASRI